ncbi:MAG: hypothetical protein CR988_06315 [Treponema sp.]|nr:MAG: hypothetical protein CR988_06315 [Treponema sp.]
MKRFFLICLFIFFAFSAVYAGDVSNLLNLGFSKDGQVFAFGQYGLTDKNFRAYAEIYIVDIEKNEFIPKGVFKTTPTKATENKESKSVFLSLQNIAASSLSKAGISSKRQGRFIYKQTEKTKNHKTLSFRDFETSDEYNVVLHTDKKGLKASFHITFDITKPDGSKKYCKVGNPNYKRKGVVDYNIKSIIISENNNSLIFVIEKILHEASGNSVRYMIEAFSL